jgi:hypothetical protein
MESGRMFLVEINKALLFQAGLYFNQSVNMPTQTEL